MGYRSDVVLAVALPTAFAETLDSRFTWTRDIVVDATGDALAEDPDDS